MNAITANEILQELDRDQSRSEIMSLDNGYLYPVLARMSVFLDGGRWAIVFDQFACNNHYEGHASIQFWTIAHGNCLTLPSGSGIVQALPSSNGPEGPTFIKTEMGAFLSPSARSFRFRGMLFGVSHDLKAYENAGVILQDPPRIEAFEVMRLSSVMYPGVFYATEEQVRSRICSDIPLVLRLYGWQHPDLGAGETMSQSPSIRAVAGFMEAGGTGPFIDPGIDNVHWKNWPAGGNL
jgi:hypothetical protein